MAFGYLRVEERGFGGKDQTHIMKWESLSPGFCDGVYHEAGKGYRFMGWRKLNYTTEKEVAAALSDLVTVTSLSPEGLPEVVGTAFPIIVSESHIALLSARHVIEGAYHRSKAAVHSPNMRDMPHLPGPDNTLYFEIEKWVKDTSDLKCLFAVDQELYDCEVAGICLRPPLDIAMIIVERTSKLSETMLAFSINSDPLRVGDEVVVTSFVTETYKPKYTRTLQGRLGQITAIDATGPLVEAPVYTTNIPIEIGASGGPVFAYFGSFSGPKQVIGVVSSDFSLPESFDSMEIDGCSRISMISSAAPLQIRDTRDGLQNFKELCEEGTIKDHGIAMKALILEYFPDGNWHQKVPTHRL